MYEDEEVKIVSDDVDFVEVVFDDADDCVVHTFEEPTQVTVVTDVPVTNTVNVNKIEISDVDVTETDLSYDTVEERAIADEPEQVSSQRLLVYVPSATRDSKGIASFNSRDFVVSDGKVSLRQQSSSGEGGEIISCGIATTDTPGSIIVGRNLEITEDGVLSVMTTDNAERDNTLPITSAGAHVILGNIDSLLKTI